MVTTWLVGTGGMAEAYNKVLQHQEIPHEVIGRGVDSATRFLVSTGIMPRVGGVDQALALWEAPENAIVAVPVQGLSSVALALVKAGTKRILLEKPGGLSLVSLQKLEDACLAHGASIWVGYNRRFYASTLKAKTLITEDGGVLSLSFEFTERSQQIRSLNYVSDVKERWLIANSTHVLDLAFFLGGHPQDYRFWFSGSLDWHSPSARFCGAGVTATGALFSYAADWDAPGRWGVEVLTRNRRLIFRPMEQLKEIQAGNSSLHTVELDDRFDRDFKPGIYRQTEAFHSERTSDLCTLSEQIRNFQYYNEIAGYSK